MTILKFRELKAIPHDGPVTLPEWWTYLLIDIIEFARDRGYDISLIQAIRIADELVESYEGSNKEG